MPRHRERKGILRSHYVEVGWRENGIARMGGMGAKSALSLGLGYNGSTTALRVALDLPPQMIMGIPQRSSSWTFNPNGNPQWQFHDNDENYATHVVEDEWEAGLSTSE